MSLNYVMSYWSPQDFKNLFGRNMCLYHSLHVFFSMTNFSRYYHFQLLNLLGLKVKGRSFKCGVGLHDVFKQEIFMKVFFKKGKCGHKFHIHCTPQNVEHFKQMIKVTSLVISCEYHVPFDKM